MQPTPTRTESPVEKQKPAAVVGQALSRGLNVRHIRFMALGSAIGTGLFYGSASAIQKAGPAVLLAYIIGGAAVFMVMRALGEMAVRHPVSGSFSQYASRYLGPLAGFVTGWTYVFEMAIVAIADVTAFSIYMGFWFPQVDRWIWILAVICFLAQAAQRSSFSVSKPPIPRSRRAWATWLSTGACSPTASKASWHPSPW